MSLTNIATTVLILHVYTVNNNLLTCVYVVLDVAKKRKQYII